MPTGREEGYLWGISPTKHNFLFLSRVREEKKAHKNGSVPG